LIDLISYSNQLIDQQSEEVIIEEAKKNPQKFEPIYTKYYKPLFRLVVNKTRDPQVAADLLSNVFCKALHNLKKFEYQGRSIYFWLYRIALNECSEHFRKKGKVQFLVLEEYQANRLYEELSVFEGEQRHRLKIALQKLSHDEVRLIELRFFEELKFGEIAEVVDSNEGHCKMRLYRALKKLKKHLGDEI